MLKILLFIQYDLLSLWKNIIYFICIDLGVKCDMNVF